MFFRIYNVCLVTCLPRPPVLEKLQFDFFAYFFKPSPS